MSPITLRLAGLVAELRVVLAFQAVDALLVLFAGALTLAAGPAALAELLVTRFTVTARRREESLQDTPIAVTAYTEDEMDLRAHLTINDVAQATPNVIFENSSNTSGLSGSPTLFIRGVGQSDFVINTDPAVGVYVDGVYIDNGFWSSAKRA